MRHASFCHFVTLNKELRFQIPALPVSPQWTLTFLMRDRREFRRDESLVEKAGTKQG